MDYATMDNRGLEGLIDMGLSCGLAKGASM